MIQAKELKELTETYIRSKLKNGLEIAESEIKTASNNGKFKCVIIDRIVLKYAEEIKDNLLSFGYSVEIKKIPKTSNGREYITSVNISWN